MSSNSGTEEQPKKKQRRPRQLSASATKEASNLKDIEQPGIAEMHRSIKQTTFGNHELLAKATKGSSNTSAPTESKNLEQAHSRELTRIVFQSGFKEIGVQNSNVLACCEAHANRFTRPKTDEERDALARKVAGKSLETVMVEMLKTLKKEKPGIKKDEALQLVGETIDDELHRLEHIYELDHGIPGIDSIEQRFKQWLGVRAGATQNELEATLREEHPDERPSRISGMARAQMIAEERKKKSAYQIHVSDDKNQQMLLRAVVANGDKEAEEIYTQFRERQIRLQASSEEEVSRRIEEMKMDLKARIGAARSNKANVDEAVDAARLMQQSVAEQSLLAVKEIDTRTGDLISKQGVVVEAGIHTSGDFLRAYNQDLSSAPEKVRMSHCNAMVADLMTSINLMAIMLAVAPPDAVFDCDEDINGDAIDNLYTLMRKDSNEASKPSSATLHLYLEQWQRVQTESQSDIDRELVRAHKHEERDAVVSEMKKRGVPANQVSADLAYGVRPEMSQVYQAIAHISHNQKFASAMSEAAETSKLKDRLDQQATAMARDANRAAAEAGRTGERMNKESALKLIFEGAARKLPVISRAYRAPFMCEPAGPEFFERPCVNNESCVCFTKRATFPSQQLSFQTTSVGGGGSSKAVNSGFVCREFLLPDQLAEVHATHKLPETMQMCWPCNVYRTTQNVAMFAQPKIGCEDRIPLKLLQDHCIIINQVGENTRESTLQHMFGNKLPAGIVRPFLAYSDSNFSYSFTIRHGKRLRCLVETDASVFRLLSDSTTRI
jgi:hypothetical protein